MKDDTTISMKTDTDTTVDLNGLELTCTTGETWFSKRVHVETDNTTTAFWWKHPDDKDLHSVDLDVWNINDIEVEHDVRGLQLRIEHHDGTTTTLVLKGVDIPKLISLLKEHEACR
jgi:hypothetical protein